MHTCVGWIHFAFFGVCDVLQFVVVIVYSAVFYGHESIYSTMVTRHFDWTTSRRGGLRFGTGRYLRGEQAVSRGRSRTCEAVNGGRPAE